MAVAVTVSDGGDPGLPLSVPVLLPVHLLSGRCAQRGASEFAREGPGLAPTEGTSSREHAQLVLLASAPGSHRAAAASVPLRRVQHGVTVLASGQLPTEGLQVPLDSEVSLLVASADVWYFECA
jgi:hypothetical protein